MVKDFCSAEMIQIFRIFQNLEETAFLAFTIKALKLQDIHHLN